MKRLLLTGLMGSMFAFASISQGNDCATATTIVQSTSCTATVGTTVGASQSQPGCSGTAEDDVWYKFIATSTVAQIYAIGDGDFDMVFQIFSGACGSLASIECVDATYEGEEESTVVTGLTIGQTYFVRFYDYYNGAPSAPTFSVCITAPCGTLTQPAGSIAEAEACGADANGGCLATPTPVYQDISCGDVIWGSGWADADSRDTDWYRFTVTQTTNVSMTVTSEFPAALLFVNISNCASPVVISSALTDGCTPETLTQNFAPGTYVAFVGAAFFTGYPCGTYNDYSLALTMTSTTPVVTATGSTTVCTGSSVPLSTTGTGTIAWYNGATLIPGATAATYTATTSGSYTSVVTNANGCDIASNAIVVTINPLPAAPTVTPDGPTTFCQGEDVVLSSSAATGNTWSNTQTGQTTTITTGGSYTVTQTTGGCTSPASAPVVITVNPTTDATFSYPSYTICTGSANPVATPTNAGGVFSSTPAGLDFVSTATGEVNMSTSDDGTYTVTYTTTNGSCTLASTHTVTITDAPDADFTYSAASYCANESDPAPSFTSGSPGVFESTTGLVINSAGTIDLSASTAGTYTVTNTIDASGACPESSSTQDITIEAPATPAFAQIANVCQGGTSPVFPSTSTNGVAGTWSPAFNNAATTMYTFTPDAGECASAATMVVTIDSPVTPAFPAVDDYCEGSTIPALPTTSTNSITGTWSPAISNTATTTYTFTPAAGQCASTQTQVITINDQVAPTFAPVAALCVGDVAPTLPLVSSNAIDGTWSPATVSTTTAGTTTYTFTPANDECASTATLQVVVDACLSIGENIAEDLTVYPNPAENEVTVSFTNATGGNVDLTLISGDGKLVYSSVAFAEGEFIETIDISTVSQGVYYIRLTGSNGVSTTKLVKN